MIRVLFQRGSLLALVAALLVPAAFAQQPEQKPQQPPQPTPPQQRAPEVETSDQEIDQFAELLLQVQEVRAQYVPKMRQTEDSQKARTLQQQMQGEIEQTIKEFDGITAERYDKIAQAARADKDLKQKILSRLEEKRQGLLGRRPLNHRSGRERPRSRKNHLPARRS